MEKRQVTSKAPGRINLIGEHTDYTGGYVMPAAIDKTTQFTIVRNGTDTTVNLRAINMNESFSFDLSHFDRVESGWPNYLMGIVDEFLKLGHKLEGFDVEFEGNVPIGAGMSSSAALDCGFGIGLSKLFDLKIDPIELILLAQRADHNFVGIKCGVMDQFASVMGKKDHVFTLDCETLEYHYHPFNLSGLRLVLLNSMVTHTLANSAYNKRREECELGVDILRKRLGDSQNFKNTTLAQLIECSSEMSETVFARSRHVISENNRVRQTGKALIERDFNQVGQLLYESHNSLKDDFEVSCSEIDFLVDLTKNNSSVLGSRIMGGGFGGCTLNLVQEDAMDEFISISYEKYLAQFGIKLESHLPTLADGALFLNQ